MNFFIMMLCVLSFIFSIVIFICGTVVSFEKLRKAFRTGDWDQAELSLYSISGFLFAFSVLLVFFHKLI